MHKRLYTVLSLFLLFTLYNSAYAYNGQSNIIFTTDAGNHDIYIVDFSVDFTAPESLPMNTGSGKFTVFIWPGLQPEGSEGFCFYPINNGVLQPVLTYGNSCAPDKPQDVDQWWISGQYVNTFLKCNSVPNEFADACDSYAHCHGGQSITINPGQKIETSMDYQSADQSWLQTINAGGQTTTYSIALNYCSANSNPATPVDMEPQSQTRAILSIETHGYDEPLTQTYENISLKIHVGDDTTATCDNTITVRETISTSSCDSFKMISNSDGILTCQIDSCTVNKPANKPTELGSGENTSNGGGCSLAPAGSSLPAPVYLMVPVFILIRRLWQGIRRNV